MRRSGNSEQAWDVRLKRLAEQIETLTEKDESLLRHTREVYASRRAAAQQLWGICSDFVAGVNALLPRDIVTLDPETFSEGTFQEDGPNLIQINVRGRILQVEFQATAELISTEDFRIPYTLEGSVRAFNQRMLDKDLIEEQLLFFTIHRDKQMWRFFDARTYRSGTFDRTYLILLMEQVI